MVDDEPKILEVVASYLESQGYRVVTAATGQEGLSLFAREAIHLVLLDLMLPDIPGEEICAILRRQSRIPVIMVTAKVEEESLLHGLGLGADDYIRKPFSLRELSARIDVSLRRAAKDPIPLLPKYSFRGGDLVADFDQGLVLKGGRPVALTPSEMKILFAMISYPKKIFTRGELLDIALGDAYEGTDRTVDTHIKNLRHKIEDTPRQPAYIHTVHGLGYRFGGE